MVKTTTVSDRLRSPNFRSLINENILGKCFRNSSSSDGLRILPLASEYGCPRLSLLIITAGLETNKIGPRALFHYSMLMYTRKGPLSTLSFFQSKSPGSATRPVKGMRCPRGKGPARPVHAVRRTGQPGPRFNYELFNCNNFNIRYWSWNYRGCWHQTCPPIVPR